MASSSAQASPSARNVVAPAKRDRQGDLTTLRAHIQLVFQKKRQQSKGATSFVLKAGFDLIAAFQSGKLDPEQIALADLDEHAVEVLTGIGFKMEPVCRAPSQPRPSAS